MQIQSVDSWESWVLNQQAKISAQTRPVQSAITTLFLYYYKFLQLHSYLCPSGFQFFNFKGNGEGLVIKIADMSQTIVEESDQPAAAFETFTILGLFQDTNA